MWIVIAILVIALLMVVMAPKPGVENARAAKLGDFQIPRSKFGDPAPLIFGTVRQKSPITLWFGDFRPIPITKKVSSGMFSSQKVIVGYKNYLGIDCFLAMGPGVVLKKFWAGTYLVWTGNQSANGDIIINKPDLFGGDEERGGLSGTITFYNGSSTPPNDAYLESLLGANVPNYNGFARAVFKNFYIGTTTNLEMFSFELARMTSGLSPLYSIMPNGLDLNPMEICYDIMTRKRGCFGNLTAELNLPSFIACAQTLHTEQLGMSIAIQSAIQGKDILEEIMRHADGILYQDPASSEIVAKLIRQDYVIDDLMVLDESIIKELKGFSKTTWESTYNQCRVTFSDRSNGYDDSVAITQDFANINFQQRVKSTEIASPGCTEGVVANKLSSRQLSLLNVPLYKCNLVCTRKVQGLRPGACFVLNWAAFGLQNMVMRVSKIDFGDLTNNEIKITCVQDRFSTSTPTFGPPGGTNWTPISTEATPVTIRQIITPPYFLARISNAETPSMFETAGRVYVLAQAPASQSIGFDNLYSFNNFATPGVFGPSTMPYNGKGNLLNAYPLTAGGVAHYDTSGSFTVTGLSQATIANLVQTTTLDQARDGSALMFVSFEWMLYVGFVNNGDGSVTFPKVYRGILDTIPEAHSAGAEVWFVSGRDGLIEPTLNNFAFAYVKFLDKTPSARLPITSAPTVAGSQDGRQGLPLHPQYLTLNGSRAPASVGAVTSVTAAWRHRSRLQDSISVYDDNSVPIETGVETRLRWRVGTGGFTTVLTTATSAVLNVTGLSGVLQVIVDSRIIASGVLSNRFDTLSMIVGIELRITEDGEERLTEDDEQRILE